MDTKKARYHITITNNETGKIQHDADACVIIGAFHDGEGVANLTAVDAGAGEFAETFADMNHTMAKISREHPEVALLASILAGHRGTADEETPTEETGGADCE